MKKFCLGLLLLFGFGASLQAKPVDPAQAKIAGTSFISSQVAASFKNATLDLVYTSAGTQSKTNYFYIFNVNQTQGFVIVSADDAAQPILGYSDKGSFDSQNIPVNVAKWLEGYKEEIRYIITNNITATDELKNNWDDLIYNRPVNTTSASGVTPLLKTTWNQLPYYNSLCPYDNTYSQRAVTGCVATAMAQVMKYWNYPTKGTGSHSYSHSTYGTLSANFGSTTYAWGSMPNNVTSSNSAVATLMYHAGVSVDMSYGVSGSYAYVISSQSPVTHCSEYALKTYFGYKNTLKGVERANYTQTNWLNLIKGELDAARPVLYAGFGSGGGHAFVCDGYDNSNYLHFNWGWGGLSDGYFSVNNLNPSLGTGGGSGNFNSGHQAVIGIEPANQTSTPTYDMRLYSSMSVYPDPINYNAAFSVTVDVANYGTSAAQNFSGDYAVAVFNSNNEFVTYIETKTGMTLDYNKHYTNPLVFSTTGIAALTPGNYSIGIYYKPTGASQWTAFANGSYQNFITVQVQGNNANPLKLYAPVTTTPTVIVQNQTFSVNFDVANYGSSTFDGEVSVDIHKSDGTWIRSLDTKTGLSLSAGYHFTSGLTYTITGGISDAPGTYQLFIWDKPTSGNWEFLGNGAYANPITIQVVAPPLNPDVYEVNNVVNQAYALPASFSGNTAKITTTGSNIHNGTDYDYYKVVLPTGYNYSIAGRIHDLYSSGNGNNYTLDGLVSFSTDGTNWSDAYDAVIPVPFTMNNGGTFYFLVSPYFSGGIGTYLLDFTITRSQVASSEKEITGFAVPGMVGNAVINSATAKVNITVNAATNVSSLTPTITVSNMATVFPLSGVSKNFTFPVNYTVTAQDGTTKNWLVTITKQAGVGITEQALEGIAVYPNPAKDILTVDLSNFDGTVNKVSITNMQGQTVYSANAHVAKTMSITVNDIAPGIYMVQVETTKGNHHSKILIQQ